MRDPVDEWRISESVEHTTDGVSGDANSSDGSDPVLSNPINFSQARSHSWQTDELVTLEVLVLNLKNRLAATRKRKLEG